MPNNTPEVTNLQLWTTRVGEHTLAIESSTIPLLSSSEKKRLDAITSSNKRRDFLLSRALMRHALTQKFNIPLSEWSFVSHSNAAPLINNLPKNTFISLSHSNGFILFATSDFPVGVDVEMVKAKKDIQALAEVFMSGEELSQMKGYNNDEQTHHYYRVWCAKEAFYKAISTEQQATINLKSLSIIDHINSDENWNQIEIHTNPFIFSIIVKNKSVAINFCKHEPLL